MPVRYPGPHIELCGRGINNISLSTIYIQYFLFFFCLAALSCSKKSMGDDGDDLMPGDSTTTEGPIDFDAIQDTYPGLAPIEHVYKWGPYNVHDPSILKDGEYYYSYSTDVAFGADIRPGIQVRRSKNLVEWEFTGWVFDGLPAKGVDFIRSHGGEPFQSLWAPYIMKSGAEYRLYYSLSSPTLRLSVIGLATANDPRGPWAERGLVVTSTDGNYVQTNAIDPAVLVDPSGDHWFYYGSAWDGIYILPLDPATGMAANAGDKGRRVAQRGFTGGSINGNIEGPEIIYNPIFDKYYLFIAYDWLETKYNVRVGRADSPEGPFLDFHGNDLNLDRDDAPMILAPYRFLGHGGWQGTSHVAVFHDGDQYYLAHQGRPGVNFYYMDMHVREIFWTKEGWPLVSPQRYAAEEEEAVEASDLEGHWERIVLDYTVVPGYSVEQVDPDFQEAEPLVLAADGTFNGNDANHWSYESPWLTLQWQGGPLETLRVEHGRDWENSVDKTMLFTGLDEEGTAVWGKKVEQ